MNFLQRFQQIVPHQLLGGRYKVTNQLGMGGFSQTFVAEDLHLPGHPRCVVKQFKPQVFDAVHLQTARRLFDTEARVLYQLGDHHQIPRLLAHFEENQEFYLVQELVEGEPLSQKLSSGQSWAPRRVVALLQDILQVLTFVHKQGVIHRDIKPSNLICRQQDGKIVLIDFGAVKQVGTLTGELKTGQLTISIGTQGYMPPEQLSGNPRFNSDIYAVGMVGIQALTGLHPVRFKQDSQTGEVEWQNSASYDKILQNEQLAAILDRMICYHFKDRYQTATEVLQALQPLHYQVADFTFDSEEAGFESGEETSQIGELSQCTESLQLPQTSIAKAVSDQPVDQPVDESQITSAPLDAIPPTDSAICSPTEVSAAVQPDAKADTEVFSTAFASSMVRVPEAASASLTARSPSPESTLELETAETSHRSALPDQAPELEAIAALPTVTSSHLAPVNSQAVESQVELQPTQVVAPASGSLVQHSTARAQTLASTAFAAAPQFPGRLNFRSLPWKLCIGIGVMAIASIPLSHLIQNRSQSAVTPSSLSSLVCREPSPPPLPSSDPNYEYPGGVRFYGPIKNGLPTDGRVTMIFPSGNRYDGEFQDGKRNGCGTLTFASGKSYVGQFKDDQFNGQGVWTLKTGERYVGAFKDNRCNGKGTFFLTDGTAKEGVWQDGNLINGNLSCGR